ncbi:MAG: adenylate/guanylate cyclase domain-containing protein, partial [Nitrosopumilaceae archaeon]
GFVIKNIGDSLLYYFPQSSKSTHDHSHLDCLNCAITMVEEHKNINKKMKNDKLPSLNFRISADYGKVTIMKTNYSSSIDVLGTPVNMCNKINHSASKNGIVIGSDLYRIVKNFENFQYKMINACSIGLKYMYPIYSVQKTH